MRHRVNPHVVADLVGKGALGYRVDKNGALIITDRRGREHFFEAEAYADILQRDLERLQRKRRERKGQDVERS